MFIPSPRRLALAVLALAIAVSGFLSLQQESKRTNAAVEPEVFQAGKNNTILLVTNSEHGLANVVLATANSLLTRYPDVDVHIASFDKLASRVRKIQQYSRKTSPSASITFHTLPGLSFGDRIFSDGRSHLDFTIAPGFSGTMKMGAVVSMFFMPWTGPEYRNIYDAVVDLLDHIDPSVAAIDPALLPAVDAVRHNNRRYAILSANTVKENASLEQGLAMLWKFPVFFSGFPFPLPWYLIPSNIFLNLFIAYKGFTAPHIKERTNWLSAHGLNITTPPHVPACAEAPLCISQSLMDAEIPYHVPAHHRPVGPMILSMALATEQDPELAAWLTKAPTLIINMGSIFTWDKVYITQMALALRKVLDATDVQVLWKLQKRAGFHEDDVKAALAPLADEVQGDRIRLVPWIKADPAAIMETGNVVLAVHHGGASSFYEPLSSGIPQLLLPQWADCYDTAVRAEYINVGIWGDKRSAPGLDAAELTAAFMTLLGNGTRAESIRRKAKEIGEICSRRTGRDWAADELIGMARLGE